MVLSPLSATLALGMALNGASGATLDSMRRTLGWGTRPMPEVNDAYRGLLALLTKSNAPAGIITSVENAIKELSAVHGTLVTKAQVDGLLDTPRW